MPPIVASGDGKTKAATDRACFNPDSRHYMVPFKKAEQAPSGPVSVSRKRPNHANQLIPPHNRLGNLATLATVGA